MQKMIAHASNVDSRLVLVRPYFDVVVVCQSHSNCWGVHLSGYLLVSIPTRM